MSIRFSLWAPSMASYGGVQSYMWRIWEVLNQMSNENELVESPVGISLSDDALSMKTHPSNVNNRPEFANASRFVFVYKAISKKHLKSIIIVGSPYLAPAAFFLKQMNLIKNYVVVIHGIEAWEKMNFLRRLSLVNAHSIIATTKYTAKKCSNSNKIPIKNFHIIPLCAEPFQKEGKSTFELYGKFPILFVGRLMVSEQYKGLDVLIKAISILQKKNLDVSLHVIGDGDDRDSMELKSKKLKNIFFYGRVSDHQLQSSYKSSKLFVMPSKGEGFGIVFLEAMRYGVPCIGGKHGGSPEVIKNGETGFLVKYGDIKNLAQKIEKIYCEGEFEKSKRKRVILNTFKTEYVFSVFKENWNKYLKLNFRSHRF